MSESETEKKRAEQKVSDALANQPKQDADADDAKEKRAEAEKQLTGAKTAEATTV